MTQKTLIQLVTLLIVPLISLAVYAQKPADVGVVGNISVLSDKVEDISSIEAWKKSYIKDGMTDQEKAIAIWKTLAKFRFQTDPPREGIDSEGNQVHDPIKMLNVYGYCQCCCASAGVECLARYVGMEARGWSITTHSVAEVKYAGAWHMLDGAYGDYWTNPNGQIAGVEEINKAIMDWYKATPAAKGKAGEYGPAKGPALLAKQEFFEQNKIPLAGTWGAVMHAFEFEKAVIMNNAYVQGYRVNIQLRPGEKITRNWSNKGLQIGGADCIVPVDMPLQKALGDTAPVRIGNGTHEFNVSLSGEAFKLAALQAVNVATTADDKATPAVHAKDAAAESFFVVRMNSSYIYLGGQVTLKAVVAKGGSLSVMLSTNHGLDYKEIASYTDGGDKTIDMKSLTWNCYDYRLKFVLKGQGTGLDGLTISNNIQHSTAVLPAIAKGDNKITFSAGPAEGTITLEGGISSGSARPFSMFHIERDNIKEEQWEPKGGKGTVTVPLETPGEMSRIRISACYRARANKDSYTAEVSFDNGGKWKTIGVLAGPGRTLVGNFVYEKIPAGATKAQIRFTAKEVNTVRMNDLRIDCDYKLPNGGFRPVQITYLWEEGGQEKKDIHVAAKPQEAYVIKVGSEPKLKSIVLELAK